jgi:hypothetical protein
VLLMTANPQIPIVNCVESLADWVRDELVRNGTVPADEHVIYSNGAPGERTTPGQNKLPMVWLWLDKPIQIDVAQMNDPVTSVAFDETIDGQTVYVQSIGVEKIRAQVIMHALVPEEEAADPSPASPTPRRRGRVAAKNAELAGTQLRQRTIAAIFRACNGSFRVLAAENLSPKGSELAYGSASQMIVELANHIPDDAYPYDSAETQTTQMFEGETVAEFISDES